MAVWSSLGRVLKESKVFSAPWLKMYKDTAIVKRNMSGHGGPRLMEIRGTKWQWHKFKDMFHFYFMLGAGWYLLVVGYTNIFIGPAQLAPIPEGYEPKHWEYYKHPITRFIARYMHPSPQQEYEKYLHLLSTMYERQQTKVVMRDVRTKEAFYRDAKNNYFAPMPADVTRGMVDFAAESRYKYYNADQEPFW